MPDVVHECPPAGQFVMPCCGKRTTDITGVRLVAHREWVTCPGPDDQGEQHAV